MAKKLEKIDSYNNFYILPTEKKIAELLSIDATCTHGYTTYRICASCLEALFSEAFAEVEQLRKRNHILDWKNG